MADSQPESNIFSLRIVSIDYYMSPPVPDMDICYSSFQGGMVNEVPVVRIYGSTPAGQKTCLHVHRALPYLYVPCTDISSQPNDGADAYTHAISLSIEKALKLKGNAASRRQHVHGCSLVRAKKFYGYHTSEELFVKIYLVNVHFPCKSDHDEVVGMDKLLTFFSIIWNMQIFDSGQLALKLIANVTYGYTAAGFSGRMPCAELADSIVQCGRLTLETAISFVNAHDKWKARVIYGDTDSMFVLLKGRSVKEAFRIGKEIVSEITAMNPVPVTLKLEKVYYPCFLITKKRYVGFSYESPDQTEPVFDAKGIETVRRDTCTAVAKTMEQSLRPFFKHQDILEVKSYLLRQWRRILSGRVSLQDFIFAKEVRLGTYSSRTSSSLPPAAIVATKAMRNDPRAEPRYGERVPYIVIHGEPGARLVDMVVDPFELLVVESPLRLNELYYINKQIIPALQRVFGLVGADLKKWFVEMPRPVTKGLSKQNKHATNPHRTRIDYYYLSKHCLLCGELVQASARYCSKCSQDEIALATAVIGKTSRLEREMQHLAAIC